MGGEVYLAEYGRAKTIHFDLVEVDGVDLRVDAVDGGADCIVMTDEAAEGTATNDFVDEGTGYSLVLTAAEMAGARITVYVIDSATKVWLDKAIHIETFGHQSSAHPNLSPYWTNGAQAGGSPTTTVFIVDGFTEATDDHLIGGILTFTSGVNLGQARGISDYDDTTGTQTITVSEAFIAAPADNDEFVIKANPDPGVHIADAVWDEIITGTTHNIATSAGRRLRELEQSFVQASGVIDTVTNGHTITLDTGAVATTDFYPHSRLSITEGTGAGQSRIITDYTSGRVCTLESDFTTNPDTASLYVIEPADANVVSGYLDDASGFVATYTNTTTITLDAFALANADYYNDMMIVFSHGTGAGQSREITAYTAGRVVTMFPALDTALDTTTTYRIVSVVSAQSANREAQTVLDAAVAEPTGVPAANESLATKISYIFMALRNKVTVTASKKTFFDDGDSGEWEKDLSDDDTTYTETEANAI